MTEKEQAAAILAALNAVLKVPPLPVEVFEYDDVPGAFGNDGTRPPRFAVISVTWRYTGHYRASGEESVEGGRLQVRYAAKSTNDARNIRRLTVDVLKDKILATEAGEIGPFVRQSSQDIAPDDGYQSGSDTFTF